MRLASRFLEAPSVLGYVNTIVYGEVRDREGHEVDICSLDDDEFLERQPATWPDTEIYILPSREQWRARRAISYLSTMIDFGTIDCDVDATSETLDGVVEPSQGPLPYNVQYVFQGGCRSKISLSKEMLADLTRTTHKYNYLSRYDANAPRDHTSVRAKREKCVSDLLKLRFLIAVTLIHEIAHSLQFAVFGRRRCPRELFYCDSKVAEAGFELEAALFGGLIDRSPAIDARMFPGCCTKVRHPTARSVFCIEKRPSHDRVEHYQSKGDSIWSGVPFRDYDVV